MTSVSAPPDAPREFVNLNGVRALAALSVLATHVGFNTGRAIGNRWYAPFLARLDFGVTLFFLLSGFLLYRPFLAWALQGSPRPSWRRFWWRRALRILPAYWLVIVVTLALFTTETHGPRSWLAYLTLTQTISGDRIDPSLSQMWTLSVELSFYAVLPLIAWLAKAAGQRTGRPIAAQLAVLGVLAGIPYCFEVAAHAHAGLGLRALLWTPCYLDWFAAGMFLALVSVAADQHRPRNWVLGIQAAGNDWRACLSLGVLLWWLATLPVAGPLDLTPSTSWQWAMKHALYLAAAAFLLLPITVAAAGRPSPVLAARPAWLLGEVSYGIYLWHLPILMLTYRMFDLRPFQGDFWLLLAAVAASATALAAASWIGMERPLLRRLAGRRPGSRLASQADSKDRTTAARQPS
jgi:peptidoglycan/LPS O-acetylase OafA/YrhL